MKTLYFNGTIITMEEELFAEAVLEENGKIVAVGKEKDVREMASGAKEVDLKGKTMLPAFIDAHSHFTAYANSMLQIPLEEASSFEEVKEKIHSYIEKNQIPDGKWVIAKGFDPGNMAEQTYPHRCDLDEAAPNHPVLLQHKSGHMGVMNTKGLEICGITVETKANNSGRGEESEERMVS